MVCALCRRHKHQVKKLILGKNPSGLIAFVCDSCTMICHTALLKHEMANKINSNILSPQEIYNKLAEVIEGQHEAKLALSIVMYNHYKLINNKDKNIQVSKSNVLLLGPTGAGKTLLVETLCKIVGLPCAIIDATTLTAAGYMGQDVETCIIKLLEDANYDKDRAEMGVVFIDEIDKLQKQDKQYGQKDISGAAVQQALLAMFSDKSVVVSDKDDNKKKITINTKNILFICAGAFVDLLPIVKQDVKHILHQGILHEHNTIKYEDVMKHVTVEHLIKYGLIAEFLGRLPIIVHLNDLTRENLLVICQRKIKEYAKIANLRENTAIEYTQDALEKIVDFSLKNKISARGLDHILNSILLPSLFEVTKFPKGSTILIEGDNVVNKTPAKIIQSMAI